MYDVEQGEVWGVLRRVQFSGWVHFCRDKVTHPHKRIAVYWSPSPQNAVTGITRPLILSAFHPVPGSLLVPAVPARHRGTVWG